jgi:hypothetical protein
MRALWGLHLDNASLLPHSINTPRNDEQAVTVHLPLVDLPDKSWVLSNRSSADGKELDLRLRDNSPRVERSESGRAIGAALEMSAEERGDGGRDTPGLPPALLLP